MDCKIITKWEKTFKSVQHKAGFLELLKTRYLYKTKFAHNENYI